MKRLITNLDTNLGPVIREQLDDNFKKIQNGVDGQSDALNKQIKDMLGDVPLQDKNEVTQARIDANGKQFDTMKGRLDADQASAETALKEERMTGIEVKTARSNSSGKNYDNLKARLDDTEANLTNNMNAKIAQISSVPETFANLSALQSTYPNGKTGLFVTADTGHKYIWANSSWVDAGFYQAVGDNLLSGEITYATPFVAPYNDLDTLPLNKIITYSTSDIKSVAHIPNGLKSDIGGATVYTLSNDSNLAGSVQYFVGQDNSTYYRIAWGDPAVYSAWKPVVDGDYYLGGKLLYESTGAPYDDLNTFPMNQTVVIAEEPSTISAFKHLPPISSNVRGLTIISHSWSDSSIGGIQIAIDTDNIMYHRISWDSDNNWGTWQSAADGNFYRGGKLLYESTGAPYDDLNTFPMNQTVVIAEEPSTISAFKHLPPISSNVRGLTIISHSWSDSSIGGIQIAIDTDNIMYHRISWDSDNNWGAWRSEKPEQTDLYPTLSLFEKVGVIGDSYASGELAFDGNYIDHYEISWLQILARKNGFTGTNFSKGGITTRTWMTDPKCMPLMQSSDEQDLYILALGINDAALGTSYIGSEVDIDNGADTFYGNYGKIIKAIQTKAPQAKLVIATIAQSNDIAVKFNEAITTIANHFAIPMLVQLDDPLFNSSYYKDNMIWGHPTAPVYSAMALAYERMIDRVMYDRYDYFSTFKK